MVAGLKRREIEEIDLRPGVELAAYFDSTRENLPGLDIVWTFFEGHCCF
jgi:hypothetical protein